MTMTTTPNVPLASLVPQFDIQLTDLPQVSLAALGQTRLSNYLPLAIQLKQGCYIADFSGFQRQHLQTFVQSTVSELEISDLKTVFIEGQLRRQQLFGQKTATTQNDGLLAQSVHLFICVESLLKKPNLWEMLIDALNQGHYEFAGQQVTVQAQVHLIGAVQYYLELLEHERHFNRLFPVFIELTPEYQTQTQGLAPYLSWLTALANQLQLSFTEDGYQALLKYSASLTEHQQRLSLRSSSLSQLLQQAQYFAGSNTIDAQAIIQAQQAKHQRHNSTEIFGLESYQDGFVHLQTSEQVIVQINGLTVIDSADFSYGEAARITATVHFGDGEISDVERKAELSGNIHAKGMMIMTACLYQIFGKDDPLHFNANIVFEQSYQEIDGDSASLAEYCCLLSAIAEQPIDQSLAITGSLDQLGNVQAIGGVNEKITGFYHLCKQQGLTGEQGVIIPTANLLQLNLDAEIVEAIAQEQFHLYHVSRIEQAIPLLMGLDAGEMEEDGQFTDQSLYQLVQQRLDKFAGHDDAPLSFWQKLKNAILPE